MALIAGALARLRETSLTLVNQVQRAGIAREQAEDMQRAAEDVRDDALDRLELQQRHLNAFAQHIGDGVVQINEHGCIVRANTVAQDIWAEVAGGEIVGQSIDTVQELLDGGSATSRYINIISLPTDGRLPNEHFTHVLLDRREHARLARLRSELVGLLADEMRNPLTSVVTALDLTLGQKNLPEDIDRVLIGARKSGQSLVDLVTTLLEITQIEQNPSILHRAPTSLCRVLEGGIAQMAPLAQQGAVTVTVEYSNDCMILMDGERMQRAFVYLLEYALRHSPTYSTVQVRIERQSGAAVVRISDQGPGLSQRQLAALFELRSAASGERGTPVLGLAFSKLIIEAHGGQLSVESTVGQGSTYAFLLPTDQEMAPMLLPPSQESELLHTEYGVR
jgi:signal transduction histidine kinase